MGGTRVSPSLIIPLTPACQVRSPLFSCFLIKMKLLYFLFCPMCSLSHLPLPYFFPLLYLLSPCHPGCAAVCVPGFPSPLTHHVGQGPTVFFLIWTVTLTMRVDDLMMGPPFLLSQSLSFPLSVSLLQWQRGQWCRLFTVSLTCPPHCTYPVGHIMKDYFNLIIAHFRLITESSKLSTLSSFFIRLNSLHSESFGVS